MDGNGRWASDRGKPRVFGHQQGAKTLTHIIRSCPKYGITHLTVYAFSPENWQRGALEVNALMRLFQIYLRAYMGELDRENVQIRIIGERSKLPTVLQRMIEKIETKTKNHTRLVVQVALNYGGRDELLHAAETLIARHQNTKTPALPLTQEDLVSALWNPSCPDPDLLIRTGGEMRLSNFMLWQLAYTEFVFLPQYWPDFTADDLGQAIAQFKGRQRRFGRIPTEQNAPESNP
jgi:undecaprenyl diphosphate synthase